MAEEKKGEETNMDVETIPSATRDQQPRFVISKWSAVAMWSWDICADTCAICRNSLKRPSIEYQVLTHDYN